MHGSSLHPGAWREDRKGRHRPDGFSLLEMMMVVTVILIVASIATPIYQTCATRAREAALRDHLSTLRALIDRFTLDNGRAPFRLEELVEKGYLGRLPTDPFTGSGVGNREQQANLARDSRRAQRLEPTFPRRHALQHLVKRQDSGVRIRDSGRIAVRVGLALPW
jgi:prepilin-type N-terminal cleavage/methylation domain-containing protein